MRVYAGPGGRRSKGKYRKQTTRPNLRAIVLKHTAAAIREGLSFTDLLRRLRPHFGGLSSRRTTCPARAQSLLPTRGQLVAGDQSAAPHGGAANPGGFDG